ncbi:hypothetical protein DPMN_026034 [Dreissena polymorpha]|uniref:Uncharacterized protein n=1 Tax=Dreissena polymorpha TaxID=45954 RepID=A0A9D4RDV7_DREPO|nr:hypothetical protein DPMN_026034 [Dreissena polymorpha]
MKAISEGTQQFHGSSANSDDRTNITTISPLFLRKAWSRRVSPTPHVCPRGRPMIYRIVIREVQYQLEVNRCRNIEIIVKDHFGWVWPIMGGAPQVEIVLIVIRDVQYLFEVKSAIWGGHGLCGRGAPGLVMAPGIVEIDCIVIKGVQYQFEVNRCRNEDIIVKGNYVWAWHMWAGRPRINCIVIREIQYQFEANQCRNEEIIVKGNFLVGVACVGVAYYGRGTPGLVMGLHIVEIDRIVIREVQYQLEVNWCRNEEIIANDNFGWVWPIMGGAPQVEIDCIVIRDVQYQFEIIVKGNFGWVWPMWAGRPRIDRIVIKEVQYQFEVNRCRNEEIIVKAIWGWCGLCGRGAQGLVMGPCIVEINCIVIRYESVWAWPMWAGCHRIDCIVIKEVQYQFEVNRCRNEEIIVKGNFDLCGRGAPGLVNGPCIVEIYHSVIREAQYQFEVNRCRNEEVNFQGSSANSVEGAGGQDGRTDGQTHINTVSPLFLRKMRG